MIYLFLLLLIGVLIALVVRFITATDVYTRILSINAMPVMVCLFIIALGYYKGRPDFIDNALLIAILSPITMISFVSIIQKIKEKKED